MSKEKPVLLPCQTCGCEPELARTLEARLGPFPAGTRLWKCPFCADSSLMSFNGWNYRQFKARHEAIEKILLACSPDPEFAIDRASTQEYGVRAHDANLARRRAEAEKLMGGDA